MLCDRPIQAALRALIVRPSVRLSVCLAHSSNWKTRNCTIFDVNDSTLCICFVGLFVKLFCFNYLRFVQQITMNYIINSRRRGPTSSCWLLVHIRQGVMARLFAPSLREPGADLRTDSQLPSSMHVEVVTVPKRSVSILMQVQANDQS